MKKTLLTLLIVLTLALSACGGQTSATPAGVSLPAVAPTVETVTQVPTAPVPTAVPTEISRPPALPATAAVPSQPASAAVTLDTSYENAASVEVQLLVGTLALEDTDLAVTKEQAGILLPLWNEFKTLSMSQGPGQPGADTSQTASSDAQAQIAALLAQIQAAMTPAQLQAIAALQITPESALTILQEHGVSMGGGPQQPGGQGGGSGQPPQGTPPAGNPPDGGPQPGGEQKTPPAGGPQAGNGQMTPPGDMFSPALSDALIQLLEKTSGTASATSSSSPAQPPAGPGASSSTASTPSGAWGAYTLDSGSETQTGQSYTAGETDESAIYVTNGSSLNASRATITTSGNTSSDENSSFYGLNAGVLAEAGSTIVLADSTITTSGSGANGAFATGQGASVTLSNVSIQASGDGGHGVMATLGGEMTLTDVDITTSGAHSAPIATDRGGGTITVTGGESTTSGQDSPCLYSTGLLAVSNSACTATGSESVVIEGANSVILTDTVLSSSKADKWGVMIYQSMSGDAEGTRGIFTMSGGSLANTATTGPLFYVTNSTAIITLKNVSVAAASGILLDASAGRWGNSGANGGTALLTADGQTLAGNITADKLSSVTLTLQNGSTLSGALNSDHTAQAMNLSLDATSLWSVSADSYLTSLDDAAGISGTTITNILGNGHTVYYDASACPALGGLTYTLSGGGILTPAK